MTTIEVKEVKQESSIELSKNSRGYTFSVKAYGMGHKEIRDKLESLTKIAQVQIKELIKEEEQKNEPN